MQYGAFLLTYAEIGLKGKNRGKFEESLRMQVEHRVRRCGEGFKGSREDGRILVLCPEEYDYDKVVTELARVFGVNGVMPVKLVPSTEYELIKSEVVNYVKEVYGDKPFTFKVFAKRADKSYPHPSPEICADSGELILKNFPNSSVDVHNPQEKIWVEVRKNTYIYSVVIPGIGGMPIGTAGKAMLLLSGGIDSPVAGYMIARRGVVIEAVYFHAPPYTSERAKQKVIDLAKEMAAFTGTIRLHIINFTDIELYIDENTPHDEITIIMRRLMMKIACRLAEREKCNGLITGESIGQVASQTIQSLYCTNEVCNGPVYMPVYRPVIAFDKQEIVDIAQRIGTYETSIEPYEDCCTIFVAKHPVTKPNLNIIKASEACLPDIEDKINEAIATEDIIVCKADVDENL